MCHYLLMGHKEWREEFLLCYMINAKPHLSLNLRATDLQ